MQKRWIYFLLLGFLLFWWFHRPSPAPLPPPTAPEAVSVEQAPSPPEPTPSDTVNPPVSLPVGAASPILHEPVAAKAAPTPVEDKTPLWLVIQRNDLCHYLKLNPETNDLAHALLTVTGGPPQPNADRVLNDLFDAHHGPFSAKISDDVFSDAEPIQFYSALLEGDLLNGVKIAKPHYDVAESLFANLEQTDPQNAAYPFFHAALLQKMKANPHDIAMAIFRALAGTHFEIFLDEIQSRFFRRGTINATGWLATQTLTSQLPSPNFSLSQNIVVTEVAPDPSQHEAVEKFGILLTQKYKSDMQRNRTLLPHRFENNCGRAILASIHAPFNDSSGRINTQANKEYGEALEKLKGKNSCDPTLFERVYFKAKHSFVN